MRSSLRPVLLALALAGASRAEAHEPAASAAAACSPRRPPCAPRGYRARCASTGGWTKPRGSRPSPPRSSRRAIRRPAPPPPCAPRRACCTTTRACTWACGCWTPAPTRIAAPLARRDATGVYSDWLHVVIDSRYDRRSGFRFSVNPRGVQRDVYHFDDGTRTARGTPCGTWPRRSTAPGGRRSTASPCRSCALAARRPTRAPGASR